MLCSHDDRCFQGIPFVRSTNDKRRVPRDREPQLRGGTSRQTTDLLRIHKMLFFLRYVLVFVGNIARFLRSWSLYKECILRLQITGTSILFLRFYEGLSIGPGTSNDGELVSSIASTRSFLSYDTANRIIERAPQYYSLIRKTIRARDTKTRMGEIVGRW